MADAPELARLVDELADEYIAIDFDYIRYVHPGHVLGAHPRSFARTRAHWIESGRFALQVRKLRAS